MDEQPGLADQFESNRGHLRAVAYRMLGSASEADDAVQEAWLRLSRSDTSDVLNLGGWLTTVVARVCLDMLRSRRARREEPLDAHEPERTTSREDGPENEALLADSVGLALLVVLEEQLALLTSEERTLARLAVVFGTVALALAAIGLYGVLSYGVTRRTGEIGIRMALGARPRDVIAMILGETVGLVATGLAVGGAAAYLASRTIASRLYGVAPRDPLTLSVATAVLLLVALMAAYVPARRASRVDPMVALHQG